MCAPTYPPLKKKRRVYEARKVYVVSKTPLVAVQKEALLSPHPNHLTPGRKGIV
jgi:dihydrofolate reductase